jgi:hypothetical protein
LVLGEKLRKGDRNHHARKAEHYTIVPDPFVMSRFEPKSNMLLLRDSLTWLSK